MKKYVSSLYIILLVVSRFVVANEAEEVRIFEKYNFEDADYKIVGFLGQSHSSHIGIGEFVIDDINSLTSIRDKWKLGERTVSKACGYSYILHIIQGRKVLEKLRLNFENGCSYVDTKSGSYFFDQEIFLRSKKYMHSIAPEKHKLESLDIARAFIHQMERNSEIVSIRPVNWMEYDGQFRVQIECKKHNYDKQRIGACVSGIESQLRKKTSLGLFEIAPSGTSKDKIIVTIKGSQELVGFFEGDSIIFKWQDYVPEVVVYKKTAHK